MTRHGTLPACRLAPADITVLAATGLALVIRLYLLSRPGYLTGLTEYDDGVYLGGAVSLLSGSPPYHGFAFVQPPGILLLMTPVALIAKAVSVTAAMAAARLLTVVASTACVTLTGVLLRHRGPLATAVACGTLAVYPDDIMAAHTLLLEPWMNLLVLSGTCIAFRAGRLAPPQRLLCAGVLFGLAAAVKYWAAIPAAMLLLACLFQPGRSRFGRSRFGRFQAAGSFAAGTAAGFAVPVLPFALTDPGSFFRATVLDQASRAGSAVPGPLRLAHLTGLADLLNDAGQLTVSDRASTLFARGDVTAAATWATSWLPVLAAVVLAALLGLGWLASWRRDFARDRRAAGTRHWTAAGAAAGNTAPEPLRWYALGTLVATLAAVLGYSAFFYHYADFPAPWLAVTAGYACGWVTAPQAARCALAAVAVAVTTVACLQALELSGLRAPATSADTALIAPGRCLVTDEISLAIAAGRFSAGTAGCPDVLDSLAVTLVAGNGVSVQGGAASLTRVTATWKAILSRARYVWLSGASGRRIPWTPALRTWFDSTFRPLYPPPGQKSEGQVYLRRG